MPPEQHSGGCMPHSPPSAPASILFYPFSPFFNLWALRYLLRVPCGSGLSNGAAPGPQGGGGSPSSHPASPGTDPGPPLPWDTHPKAGVPVGTEGVCCHHRAGARRSLRHPCPGDDPRHHHRSRSGRGDPPGPGERGLGKGAFQQRSWLGFTSSLCLWSSPPAAFPRSATECFVSLEALFVAR